jgi:uncharacterized protein (DUF305 family)
MHRPMTKRLTIAAIAFALLALSGSLIGAAIPGRAAPGTPAPIMGSAPCRISVSGTPVSGTPAAVPPVASPVGTIPFDLIFLDLMIRQRERISAVGALADAGADHSDLADTGRSLAADAAADAAQLRNWRVEWYGDIPPLTDRAIAQALDRLGREKGLQRGVPGAFEILGMSTMVADLCRAAPPYDLALLESLIPALNAELLLAHTALDLGVHAGVRDMAQRVIAQDQPRLDALIAWRTAWYAATPVAAATPSP